MEKKIQKYIQAKQIEGLINQAPYGAIGQTMLFLLLGGVLFYNAFPKNLLLLLITAGIFLQLFRVLRSRGISEARRLKSSCGLKMVATLEAFLSGMVWAALFWCMDRYSPPELHLLAIAFGIGMAGAAIVTMGYVFQVYAAFITPIMGTIISLLLLEQTHLQTVIALAALLGVLYLLSSAKRFNDLYQDIHKQNIQVQQINDSKNSFIANMSHEIRTPMNAIMGLNDLVLSTSLDKEQRGYLVQMAQSSKSLLGILNDILDHVKVEQNKLEIVQEKFELKPQLNEVYALFLPSAEQKGLALEIEFAENLPTYLVGDALRIKQVLGNLVSNAIKFTELGGVKILISSKGLSIAGPNASDDWQPTSTITFSVSDSGIGLSDEEQKRLFQPFVQADSTITRKFGGTGLGLSICQSLVELMGGELYLVSKKGKGAVFSFDLSLTKSDEAPVEKRSVKRLSHEAFLAQSIAKLNDLSALVVEDNYVNQKVILGQFDKLGLSPLVASNGQDAVDLVRKNPQIDIVLMDVHMPVMGGVEAAQKIRNIERLRHIPIVAVTAAAMEEDVDRCLSAGMVDVLSKPFTLVDLVRMLLKFGKKIDLAEVGVDPQTQTHNLKTELEDLALQADIPVTHIKDLLELFIREYVLFDKKITTLIAVKNWEELAFYLHQFNGVCSSFKLMKLKKEIARIEKTLQDQGQVQAIEFEYLSVLVSRSIERFKKLDQDLNRV